MFSNDSSMPRGAVATGFLAAAAIVLTAFAADARPGQRNFPAPDLSAAYDRVAEFSVRDGRDRDVLELAGDAAYGEARFCVSFTPVEFRDVKIEYADAKEGAEEFLHVRRLIRSANCTRDISLLDEQGEPRGVKRLELNYSAYIKSGIQPVVTVYFR